MDEDILQTTRKAKRSAPEDEPFRAGYATLFWLFMFGGVAWDYSAHLLNPGGRVSLKMALMWGATGVAIATLASYVVIFAARAMHSRTLLKVSFSVPRFLAAMAVLVFECFLVEGERTAESVLCCAAVALLYVRPLIKAARSGFREILPRRPR